MAKILDVNAWIHSTPFGRHQQDTQEVECWFYRGSVQVKRLICEKSENGDYGFSEVVDTKVIDANSIAFDDGKRYWLLRRVNSPLDRHGCFKYAPLDLRRCIAGILSSGLSLISVGDWIDSTPFDGDDWHSRFEVKCWCFRGKQKYTKTICGRCGHGSQSSSRGAASYGFVECWNVHVRDSDCIEFDDASGHWFLRRYGIDFDVSEDLEDSDEDIVIPSGLGCLSTSHGYRVGVASDLDDWSINLDELGGEYWEQYSARAEMVEL